MPSSQRETLVIGRSGRCDIVLEDESVSRTHAEVTVTASGRAYVTDRASSRGTFVDAGDGRRSIAQAFVGDDDVVWFGDARLTGSELLARARSRIDTRPAAASAPPAQGGDDRPRAPRWDSERGRIRDSESRGG